MCLYYLRPNGNIGWEISSANNRLKFAEAVNKPHEFDHIIGTYMANAYQCIAGEKRLGGLLIIVYRFGEIPNEIDRFSRRFSRAWSWGEKYQATS